MLVVQQLRHRIRQDKSLLPAAHVAFATRRNNADGVRDLVELLVSTRVDGHLVVLRNGHTIGRGKVLERQQDAWELIKGRTMHVRGECRAVERFVHGHVLHASVLRGVSATLKVCNRHRLVRANEYQLFDG